MKWFNVNVVNDQLTMRVTVNPLDEQQVIAVGKAAFAARTALGLVGIDCQ